jgi:hypothetical protein
MAAKKNEATADLRSQLKAIEQEYLKGVKPKAKSTPKADAVVASQKARAKELAQEPAPTKKAKAKTVEVKDVPKATGKAPVPGKKPVGKKVAAPIDIEADADEEAGTLPTGKVLIQLDEMVKNVTQLDSQLAGLEMQMKALQENKDKLIKTDIPELLKTARLKKLQMEDGTVVEVKSDIYPSVKKEDEPKLYVWLRKNGHGSIIKNIVAVNFGMKEDQNAAKLIKAIRDLQLTDWEQKESIHAGTFKAFVREMKENGNKLPPIVSIFENQVAEIKRPKNGNEATSKKATSKTSSQSRKGDKF